MAGIVPKGWVEARLPDVASDAKFSIVDGPFGSDLKLSDYVENGEVPVLTTKNLNGKFEPETVRYISRTKFEQIKRSQIKPGDILIAKIGSIGKCCIYPEGAPVAIIPANLCKITVYERLISKEFLLWRIRSQEFQDKLKNITSATAQPAFSVKRLKTLAVAVPPLNEQHRIVAKLEKLLARVDKCKERLDKIPAILKRFRQSVLAAACSGRLTADWRATYTNGVTITELLDGLRTKRLDKSTTPAQRARLRAVFEYKEKEDSATLPQTWRYVALDKLCYGFQYGTSTKSHSTGKIAVLRMGNIQNGRVDWSNLVYTSDRSEMEKYHLTPGTVLFNRTNSPELVGKTGIYRGEQPAIFAGYLSNART